MKKVSTILWGVILVVLGGIFALNAMDITNIDIFFDGWWTLLIIVPCAIGLFKNGNKSGNIIGILVGVILLLCCQNVLDFSMIWKLIVPVFIIAVGLKMIFGNRFNNKANELLKDMRANGTQPRVSCAAFSGQDMHFDGEIFDGAELTATFGGIECDLRNAIIDHDCVIKVTALFGGIDIFVPENVNVKVSSNCLFGGISNKAKHNKDNAVTLYVTGTCMFGGVDIK